MLFQSVIFIKFFLILFFLFLLARRLNSRLIPLLFLVGSYYFYASWNLGYLALLVVSTLINFYIGGSIYRSPGSLKRKLYLSASIALNLSILGFFKYYNFLIENIGRAVNFFLNGGDFSLPGSDFLLPVGISFYTFQTMSYTIDIYRNRTEPRNSIIDFATYVAFFPQLVAGPIIRSRDFFPYLDNIHIRIEQVLFGICLFSIGVFKKVVIADLLALSFVDSVFSHIRQYSLLDIAVATVGYAFQIYNDFSGYSDMAIGLGLMLGFQFPENFNYPYLSKNIREFWSRWHISLSTWLRDYLYIPLGGNRDGAISKYRNIFITMALGGLWHGANWNFFIWGIYHGLLVVMSHIKNDYFRHLKLIRIPSLLQCCMTFVLVCGGWFIFRIESAADMLEVFSRFSNIEDELALHVVNPDFWAVLSLGLIQQILSINNLKERLLRGYTKAPIYLQAFVPVMTVVCIYVFNIDGYKAFIYFQF